MTDKASTTTADSAALRAKGRAVFTAEWLAAQPAFTAPDGITQSKRDLYDKVVWAWRQEPGGSMQAVGIWVEACRIADANRETASVRHWDDLEITASALTQMGFPATRGTLAGLHIRLTPEAGAALVARLSATPTTEES